jgi:putative hemolysin
VRIEIFGIVLAGLVTLDLLYAAVRGSLLNARLPLLMNLAEDHPEEVTDAMTLLEKPRLRTSLRIGVVLTHFALAGCAVWFLIGAYAPATFGMALGMCVLAAMILLALEHLLEGVLLPKAEWWALRFTATARILDLLLSPLSSLYVILLGSPALLEKRRSPVTEYELRNWVEDGEAEGSLEKGEREMIYSIFHFGDTLCREIMVPRIDMLACEINTSLEDAIRALTESGHSRMPVYEETIDNIIGVLYSKDLLGIQLEGQNLLLIRSQLRPAYFVPEAKKVDELLDEMQSQRMHMAIVVDEYGGVAGIVTLEDIVEEIVGEIRDEYDQKEEQIYQEVGPREYIFQGRTDLENFNEVMGSHLDRDVADTLGGLVYAHIGRVPLEGETVELDGLVLQVEHVTGRRIRTVRATWKPEKEETEEKEHDPEQ